MMKFKQFINEGTYPVWVRFTVGTLVVKIINLSKQIEQEKDPIKQNRLISQQNKLLSYISGLSVGIGTDDKVLLQRLKTVKT